MRLRSSSAPSTGRRLRVLIAIVVLAVACQATVETTTSTTEMTAPPPAATTVTSVAPNTSSVPEPEAGGDEEVPAPDPGRTYRVGLAQGIVGDETGCEEPEWADTRPSLYAVAMPGLNVVPDLAKPASPPRPEPDGDEWVVEVPLRDDATWSDGHPITAGDVVFTFDLLAKPWWPGCHQWLWFGAVDPGSERIGVLGVEAADEHLVRITFNGEPGLRIWPHSIGTANIIAEQFWSPYVAAARTAGDEAVGSILDPAEAVWRIQREAAEAAGAVFTKTSEDITQEEIDAHLEDVYDTAVGDILNNVSGIGEPSGGPMVFADWDPGVSITFEANRRYYRSGEVIRSGDVTYTMGPFVDEHTITVYGSENEVVLALLAGEVDHAGVNGTSPVVEGLARRHEDVAVIDNTSGIFWYLGFNLRKPPMSDLAFRRALATVVDRDFLTGELFQGAIPPAWTLLPESNLEYLDTEAAAEISSKYRNLDRFERLEKAVTILEEAGYTWDMKPTVRRGDDGDSNGSIEPGSGIRYPDATPVPELEIVHFGAGFFEYYWFTAYGLYIEQWLQDLGFPARAQVSRGDYLVERLWPGAGREPTFDMYLLGWGTEQVFPIVYEFLNSRFLAEVNDGNNAVGYVNPEYDQLTEQLNRATTVEDARRIVWQLESIIDRDLPYIVLNGLSHSEAYRTRMVYPFTDILDGTLNYPEFAGLVRIQE